MPSSTSTTTQVDNDTNGATGGGGGGWSGSAGAAAWQASLENAQWLAANPGFEEGDRYATGIYATGEEYKSWYQWIMKKPGFAKAYGQLGNELVRFEWNAHLTGLQGDAYDRAFNSKFGMLPSQFMTSGGGGSYGGGGASKAQQIEAAMAAIRNQAATLGLPIDDTTLRSLATTVVNDNWSGDMLTDHLLKDPSKVTLPGTYMATADQIRSLAKRQLIGVSDATAQDWSRRVLSGEMSMDSVLAILQQQAAAEFGWAAQGLQTGATMSDLLAPARDTIARELEMNAADIDLMDPKWRSMVQTVNPNDNSARAATLTEVVKAARKDTAWAQTSSAANMATSVAAMVRRVMEG